MKKKQKTIASVAAVALATAGLVTGGMIMQDRAGQAEPTNDQQALNVSDVAKADAESGEKVFVDSESQVIKNIGEPGKLTVEGESKPSFEITVKKVQVLKSCTLRGTSEKIKPENGYFLVVDAEAWLSKSAEKYVDEEIALMPLDASVFGVSSGQNKPIKSGLDSVAAFSCDLKNAMDIAVGAGDRVSGQIILDSPYSSGQVVYDPKGTGGWTWDF